MSVNKPTANFTLAENKLNASSVDFQTIVSEYTKLSTKTDEAIKWQVTNGCEIIAQRKWTGGKVARTNYLHIWIEFPSGKIVYAKEQKNGNFNQTRWS